MALRVELLTIGREILDGRVVDTNSVRIAESLRSLGLVPRAAQRVDDDIPAIVEALHIATQRADVLLVTGGLGPTSDDLTAEALAAYLGEKTQRNAEAYAHLEKFLAARGRPMKAEQEKQTLLPPSAEILPNPNGTACGFWVSSPKKIFFMPGIPSEMLPMLREHVLPKLAGDPQYRSQSWATQFTSEGALGALLEPVRRTLPAGFELSFQTRFPENHIGLHASCANAAAQSAFEKAAHAITELLGESCFAQVQAPHSLPLLEEIVLPRLAEQNVKLACIESCTGGLLSHRLSNVPGASDVLYFSAVTYHNQAKIDLGVDPAIIKTDGAVSENCARAMAEAGLARLRALGAASPVCVSTTGIAGPGGGTSEKPVGLCHIALAAAGRPTLSYKVVGISGRSRPDYKQLFSQHALELLRNYK